MTLSHEHTQATQDNLAFEPVRGTGFWQHCSKGQKSAIEAIEYSANVTISYAYDKDQEQPHILSINSFGAGQQYSGKNPDDAFWALNNGAIAELADLVFNVAPMASRESTISTEI